MNSNSDRLTDEQLAARVAQRDHAAFAILYDRYAPGVYALAARMNGRGDAEDIVQEVFLKLWNRAAQFDARQGVFAAWFMAIARHRVLDEWRKREPAHNAEALEVIEELLADAGDLETDVIDAVMQADRGAIMARALAKLPAEQRHVIVLAYFGGLTQSQIAAHENLPLGTVKKRVRLAMQKLRVALGGEKNSGSNVPRGEYEKVGQER